MFDEKPTIVAPLKGSLASEAGASSIEAALAAAYSYIEAGNADAAEQAVRTALLLDPACAEAHAVLGTLHEEAGRPGDAAACLERAVALDPSRTDWLIDLGRQQLAAGWPEKAVECYRRVLERRPDSASAHRALARVLAASGDLAAAVDHFREALFLDPHDSGTAVALAEALLAMDEPVTALEVLQPTLRRHPEDIPALVATARAWLALDERDKAARVIKRCLAADPNDRFGVQGLLTQAATEAGGLSRHWVRALFDTYADRFDGDLVGRLGYRGPEVLRAAVDRVLGGRKGLDVLDVGCGTGLAGAAFRDLAARLEGSDLSPRMVKRAMARGVYDRVEVAELTESLVSRAGCWDLVVAADVLVYVGELTLPFVAAATALRPGGYFAATAERHEGDGFLLGPARRYAHSEAHIRDAAAAAGLTVELLEPASPRNEKGQPVPGWAMILRKAEA